MSTFNYSKLAKLTPKHLREVEKPDLVESHHTDLVESHTPLVESKKGGGFPPVESHQTPQKAGFPPDPTTAPTIRPGRKGDRHSNRRVTVTTRYNPVIFKKIKSFCTARNLRIQDFYELAAVNYMEVVESRLSTMVDCMQAHDDLMIYKTTDDIIMLYGQFTGRKWTPSDDRVGTKFNNTDRRLVEIAMIHTVINARGKKINSFAYFVPEIQMLVDLHYDNQHLDVYLKSRRERFAKWKQEQASGKPSSPEP